MAYFQKTIVRYERDPRAAEDADFYEKWYCPCFLGSIGQFWTFLVSFLLGELTLM